MRATRRVFVLLTASAFLFALGAQGQDQDSPSLGDVARQSRLQKQQRDAQAQDSQAKDTQAKDSQDKDAQPSDVPVTDVSPMPASGVPPKDLALKSTSGKDTTNKDTAAKTTPSAKAPKKVITNEELYDHFGPDMTSVSGAEASSTPPDPQKAATTKGSAEDWRSQIQAQKSSIAALQGQIDSLNDSIHYAPGNCVSGCVEWNQHQKEKQDQVEALKTQLADQQKHLEEMQDNARQQGYGSSVYDP